MVEAQVEKFVEVEDPKKQAVLIEKERAMVLANVVKGWNGFVRGLLSSVQGWERYKKAMLDGDVKLEEFPLECQKMFYLFPPNADISLMIEDMVTHPRIEEYLKTQFITIK